MGNERYTIFTESLERRCKLCNRLQRSYREISQKGHQLSDLTFDHNFDNDLEIMPIVKNVEHFNHWLHAYPFYNNIKREGVELYVA